MSSKFQNRWQYIITMYSEDKSKMHFALTLQEASNITGVGMRTIAKHFKENAGYNKKGIKIARRQRER